MTDRTHHRTAHRPALPGAMHFEAIDGGPDPAILREAADRAALALVRGARGSDDPGSELTDRVVGLAETEGLETLAELWSGAAPDSVAGSLWRLYLLRTWVHRNPHRAAEEFAAGRASTPVAEAIAGVVDPPGPAEVCRLVDEVLAGVVAGDYADVLFRAAAFAQIVATGRAASEDHEQTLAGVRLLTVADQLAQAGRLELAGELG